MTLTELYKKSVVYPGLILILIASIYSVVFYWDYQSETYTTWELVGTNIVFALVYGLSICLLSRTIFLNKSEKISSSLILSALSWLLLPFGFMLAVIGKAINEYVTVGSTWEILYATVASVPFIVGLIWGFKMFQKNRPPLTERL